MDLTVHRKLFLIRRNSYGLQILLSSFAAGYGRKDVVEHLLALGANINARDEGGLTCLHNAASFGHSEVVRLLLAKGADVNARDNWKVSIFTLGLALNVILFIFHIWRETINQEEQYHLL